MRNFFVRNLFVRILLIHLAVISIFLLGLLILFDLFATIQESKFSFFLLLSAALLLALVLSLSAARNLTVPLEALYRRIKSFPNAGSTLLHKSSIQEMDNLSIALDGLLHRLSSELVGHKIEKELLQSLLGALRDGVLCLNRDGLVLYQNPAIHRDLVAPASNGKPYFKAIVNSALLDFVHSSMRGPVANEAAADRPEREKQPENGRAYIEIHQGGRHFRVQAYPVAADPEVDMQLILIQDRTQEYNARRLREDFLQNASHELKTPITSIRGYAETLVVREERQPQKSFLDGVLRNVERMEAIIEDMVMISSLESRSFPFNPALLSMDRFMRNIESLAKGAVERKSQRLVIEDSRELQLEADPLLLEHLLLNLISNAARYSPSDTTITVRIRVEGAFAAFEVEDEGPGVAPDLREKIFERFFRADADRSRVQGGTGLGLSIVRQITRLHNGRAWVDEGRGGGALFKVLLPLVVPRPESA